MQETCAAPTRCFRPAARARWVVRAAVRPVTASPWRWQAIRICRWRRWPTKSTLSLERRKMKLGDLMEERWTLSPPDSFLGSHRGGCISSPDWTSLDRGDHFIDLYAAGASGRRAVFDCTPHNELRQRSNRAWLRALDADLSDSAGLIALITVKKRRSGGPLRYFEEASRAVCGEMDGLLRCVRHHPSAIAR